MGNRTPLYDWHLALGATMAPFAGWDMPLHYGSQIAEHHAVRRTAGLFDVSHMRVVDIEGDGAGPFLRWVLANDVDRLHTVGSALYTCLLDERGGILDDLLVYFLADDRYRLVVNAGTADKDLAWLRDHASAHVVEVRERLDLAMLAVQGPQARDRSLSVLGEGLRAPAEALMPFRATWEAETFVARTGYTGEDGFELIVPGEDVGRLAEALLAAGVVPAGLGARDTLRLEAGLNLYGRDMDETVTPLVCGLGWTVAWSPEDRHFIGREVLEAQRQAGVSQVRAGLVLEGRGVLRDHQAVRAADGREGEITSGSFSPTMKCAIALARMPPGDDAWAQVEIRGQERRVLLVDPPFVRRGEVKVDLSALRA